MLEGIALVRLLAVRKHVRPGFILVGHLLDHHVVIINNHNIMAGQSLDFSAALFLLSLAFNVESRSHHSLWDREKNFYPCPPSYLA